MTSSYPERMKAIGVLMAFAALILRNDLFPDHARYGHWFWIGIAGFVLQFTGYALRWASKRKEGSYS
jgi:hypothetical protein